MEEAELEKPARKPAPSPPVPTLVPKLRKQQSAALAPKKPPSNAAAQRQPVPRQPAASLLAPGTRAAATFGSGDGGGAKTFAQEQMEQLQQAQKQQKKQKQQRRSYQRMLAELDAESHASGAATPFSISALGPASMAGSPFSIGGDAGGWLGARCDPAAGWQQHPGAGLNGAASLEHSASSSWPADYGQPEKAGIPVPGWQPDWQPGYDEHPWAAPDTHPADPAIPPMVLDRPPAPEEEIDDLMRMMGIA